MVVLDSQGRGLVAALQLALARATSPYVARLDADDEALPRRLEASVVTLEVGTRIQGIPVVSRSPLAAGWKE